MAYIPSGEVHDHGCACAACACDRFDGAQTVEGGLIRDDAFGETPATFTLATPGVGAGLISGRKWINSDLTFSFPTSSAAYGPGYGEGEPLNGFASFNAAQQAAARFAFEQFASVSGLTFTETFGAGAGDATIRLGQSATPSTAWAYYPSSNEEAGDAWFGTSRGFFTTPTRGDYAWHTILHEIGHTVGLKHGHEGSNAGPLPRERDSMEFSVMTYRSYIGDPINGGYDNERFSYAQTLMQSDISALQSLYGANYEHRQWNTTYEWSPTTGEMFINGEGQGAPGANRIFSTIWDGGGRDTFRFSDYATDLVINLEAGAASVVSPAQLALLSFNGGPGGTPVFASGNIYTAELFEGSRRNLIENAVGGSGRDEIKGNNANNQLFGGGGADALTGKNGNDTLKGGDGDDTLFGNNGGDKLVGEKGDDVLFGGNWNDRLHGWAGDDRLFGGRHHDSLIGDAGDDELSGDLGRDSLFGGTGEDRLDGGGLEDLLVGGRDADIFVFVAGHGDDRIADFQRGLDRVDLSALGATFAALSFEQDGQDARLILADGTITFAKILASRLTDDDFIL